MDEKILIQVGSGLPAMDAQSALPMISDQLPEPLRQGYQWHNPENERDFAEYLEGLIFSHRHGLDKQVVLYKERVLDILTKDMAQRTQGLVAKGLGYNRDLYYSASGPAQSMFSVPIRRYQQTVIVNNHHTQQLDVKESLVYKPILQFDRMIPPQALRALTLLEGQGITPEAF